MVSVRIKGANQLGDLAKRLKAEGEAGKGLRKELYSGIQRAAKPLKAEAKAAAQRELPHSGGLNEVVAGSKFSTRTRSTGRNVGVTITSKGQAVRSADRGFIRHPVFGNREVWVNQKVDGGWFTDTMRRRGPKTRVQILQAMSTVARRITKG